MATLERLIADREKESLTLDYKRSEALGRTDRQKDELAKDVSALANSAGGVLVYGIAEVDNLPDHLDGGLDPTLVTRESIEDVIHGRVNPRIDGMVIKPIEVSPSPQRMAYVISVPPSLRAPHMASDHRYYKRFNFKSEPMEDYEVRDVMGRLESPALRLVPKLPEPIYIIRAGQDQEPVVVPISLTVINDAPVPAEFALIRVGVDIGVDIVDLPAGPKVEPKDQMFESPVPAVGRFWTRELSYEWGVPPRLPIWFDAPQTLGTLAIRVARAYRFYGLHWRIDSPRMRPTEGIYTLHCSGAALQLAAAGEAITTA